MQERGPVFDITLPQRVDAELSSGDEDFLRMQIYYFVPFLRKFYEFLRRGGLGDPEVHERLVLRLKELACYYAGVLLFGGYEAGGEQRLIDALYSQFMHYWSVSELAQQLSTFSENTFNKSDGYVQDYLYGTIPSSTLRQQQLPGFPHDMGASGGILRIFSSERRRAFFRPLVEYIQQSRQEAEVAVWGNVARGVIDAAALFGMLKRQGVPTTFHFYRSAVHASNDKAAFALEEISDQPQTWAIAVDSMTAGGKSVPQSAAFLQSLHPQRASMFLTFLGYHWADKMEVEFQSPDYPDYLACTLLKVV